MPWDQENELITSVGTEMSVFVGPLCLPGSKTMAPEKGKDGEGPSRKVCRVSVAP